MTKYTARWTTWRGHPVPQLGEPWDGSERTLDFEPVHHIEGDECGAELTIKIEFGSARPLEEVRKALLDAWQIKDLKIE